jgi:hypothetical protein
MRRSIPRAALIAAGAMCLAVGSGAAQCNEEDEAYADSLPPAWYKFDYAKHRIDAKAFRAIAFTSLQLGQIRGVIFGRHGRVFEECEIQRFLDQESWYKRDTLFTNARLTAADRWNLDLVRGAEAALHPHVQLGDMRYWQDSVIPIERYPTIRGDELRLLAAEIQAVHGRRFENEPWMQKYFEERYWYKPDSAFEAHALSKTELENLASLTSLLNGSGNWIHPGEMSHHATSPITDSMLAGASLLELRILRNEVYALHGRRFQTPWLRYYFNDQPWYKADPSFKESDLTAVDRQNIATIVAYESKLHESLSTQVISDEMLGGLLYEDTRRLRNEIYARHGRTFKDPSLREYFSSLPWYKPNPEFKESDLNAIELQNVQILLAHQSKAEKFIGQFEG